MFQCQLLKTKDNFTQTSTCYCFMPTSISQTQLIFTSFADSHLMRLKRLLGEETLRLSLLVLSGANARVLIVIRGSRRKFRLFCVTFHFKLSSHTTNFLIFRMIMYRIFFSIHWWLSACFHKPISHALSY